MGYDLEQAGQAIFKELYSLAEEPWWAMSLLLLEPHGQAMGFSSSVKDDHFLVMTPEMSRPEERARVIVSR